MNRRIEYIDAMRGLAMTLVVICHFFTGSFHCNNALNSYAINILQIPLFFMISGFFAPHMLRKPFIHAILDKFLRLVLPAILMLSLYLWVFNLNFISALFHRFKEGYWFTFVMFGYTIIYIITAQISKRLRLSDMASDCLHLFVGLLITYTALATNGLSDKCPAFELFSTVNYNNYFFYALGAVLFSNRHHVFKALNNRRFLGGSILFYIIGQIAVSKYGVESLRFGAGITNISIVSAALLIIWKLFDSYPQLSSTSAIGRFFTLVGRRSLDVYFIHYFFLPKDLNAWGIYFESIDGVFISYLCAIGLSIPLIYASLGIGYIIRLSPITSQLLLGVFDKKHTITPHLV